MNEDQGRDLAELDQRLNADTLTLRNSEIHIPSIYEMWQTNNYPIGTVLSWNDLVNRQYKGVRNEVLERLTDLLYKNFLIHEEEVKGIKDLLDQGYSENVIELIVSYIEKRTQDD